MDMIMVFVNVALIGLFCWAITYVVPMPDKFKQIINVLGIVGAVVYALRAFGLFPH